MDLDHDYRRHIPGGGRARDMRTGSIHLSVRSGSRSRGASASAAFAYVTRTGDFAERELDEALYVESDHMPAWAEEEPQTFWEAADLYERANGRLFVSADFALPRDLDHETQIALASGFVHALTDNEQLPYTLAIHAGRDAEGREHNPHAHVLISERSSDGIARPKEQWFRRANAAHPERGGAPKSRAVHGPAWMEHTRARWADLTNKVLAERGRDERVDHRSYARQGIDREPGIHFGPAAAHLFQKGRSHDRLEESAKVDDLRHAISTIDREIEALESERAHIADVEPRKSESGGGGPSRTSDADLERDDWSPGR
ncbi:MAG: MobA/MobL family protein [Vicinamibacterales bacterium]